MSTHADGVGQKNSDKTALITGASGGIGYELTRLFARDGYNLVLTARSEDKMDKMKAEFERRKGIRVTVIGKDLTRPEAPQEIADELESGGTQVDILVNNAGFTVYGPFVETDLKREIDLLQVNIMALTKLSGLFLPGMVERGWGRVLNLASTAAFMPGPLMATYYASKAYVLSFSQALANELHDTGVTVTALCPGATETDFQKRGDLEGSRLFDLASVMDAKTVAKIGYRALMKGQTEVIAGLSNWLVVEGVRFVPRKLAAEMARQAQAKK